jgi:N-acetylmuramoyl-L-alanine amidase/PKD domain/Ig-like domain CHU_C associated
MKYLLIVFALLLNALQSFSQPPERKTVEIDFTQKMPGARYVGTKVSEDGLSIAGKNEKRAWFESAPIRVPLSHPTPFFTITAVVENNGFSISPIVHVVPCSFEISKSTDSHKWTDWEKVALDEECNSPTNQAKMQLTFIDVSIQYVKIRVSLLTETLNDADASDPGRKAETSNEHLTHLSLHFYSPGEVSISPKHIVTDTYDPSRACPCPQPAYVNRLGWGCPDGQTPSCSSPTYTTVTHLIVHHSAGSNSSGNWPAVVNAIWNDHVNVNGWCDIGYNWLVDPTGVLYEGRGGGNNVVGAHFCGTNGNTMGTCMMGNYMTVNPTTVAVDKLKQILAWKCCESNIDPLATSVHAGSGLTISNISGHRNGCSTSCPGDLLYTQLPQIRTDVSNYIGNSCTPATPANDNPCGAIALAVGSGCNFGIYSNNSATNSSVPTLTDTLCDGPSNGDVWFSAIVPPSGRMELDTQPGSINDIGIGVYTGTGCNSLTFHSCYRNGSTTGLWMPVAHLTGLAPGTTIWIRAWEFNNNNFGTFGICAWDPCPALPLAPTVAAQPSSICAGDSVTLTLSGGNTGTGGVMVWYTGGCATGNPVGSGSVFQATPVTTTTFYVRAEGNCGNSVCGTATVTVIADPQAAFTQTITGVTQANFTNQSVGATSWNWNFGDGGTSILQHPTHNYATGGVFTVTLIVTNDCGSDTTTAMVTINLLGISTANLLSEVEVYPNPGSGEFFVSVPAGFSGSATVTDLVGRALWDAPVMLTQGINAFTLQVAEGMYLLHLESGGMNKTVRLFIGR